MTLTRWTGILALAASLAILGPVTARAQSGDVPPPCSASKRATINPKGTPTDLDLNKHGTFDPEYEVSQCDLTGQDFPAQIQGLDDETAAQAEFEAVSDEIGFLHLSFDRSKIDTGTSTIRVVVSGDLVRAHVLTLTLKKHSRAWVVWVLGALGVVGGLAIFGLRSVKTTSGWLKFWMWPAFKPVAGVLAIGAGVVAAIPVILESYSSHWAVGDDWWSLLLKSATACIGGATVVATTHAVGTARKKPKPGPT